MDNRELVEEITKLVLEQIKAREQGNLGQTPFLSAKKVSVPISHVNENTASCCNSGDFSDTTVLFTGNDEDVPMLEKIVNGLGISRNKMTLIMAGEKRSWPSSVLTDKFGKIEHWDVSQKQNYKLFLPEFQTLIIPLFNFATLVKIASLQDDAGEVKLIVEALKECKKVFIIPDGLLQYSPLLEKIKDLIKSVNSYGIKCLNIIKTCSTDADWSQKCAAVLGECSSCGHCVELLKDKVQNVVDSGADRVSSTVGVGVDKALAAMIDHTLLKADATREQVIKLCEEAKQYVFASVCVNPSNVKLSAEILRGTPVKVCTVVGFPLGATTTMTKVNETRDAVANGATEIDMVINVGALKARQYDLVRDDIASVVEAAGGNIVKVILETALLTDEEKVKACELSKEAGADFVKTSTGFGPGGATAEDIALMRKTVGKYMGVKASGGIRDFETAQKMIKAGASRVGASASVAIVKKEKSEGGKY